LPVIAAAMSLALGGASIGAARPEAGGVCGVAWTVAPQPVISGSGGLDDMAAISPTDAWGVGSRYDPADQEGHTLIERHDGVSWSIVPSPDGPDAVQSSLSGVAARDSADDWAVGTFIKPNNLVRTLIEHWDGIAWTRVKSPNAGQPAGGSLSGVAALAADDAWAVGGYGQGVPGRTLIEHWNGTSWSVVPSPNKGPFPNSLSDVVAVAPDDVWAVGTWFTKAFDDRTLTLHWDGTSWSVVSSPTPGRIADFAGVVVVATDDAWAVGGWVDPQANALRTLVEHWDGTSWTVVESANKGSSDNHLWGIAAAAGRMLAVGDRFSGGGNGPVVPLALERCAI
jgi:hypothetical protein